METAPNADQIIGLTPNPASNSVLVQYQINNASSAYLKIVGLYNGTSDNYIIDLTQTQTTIDLSTYQTGIYPVILVVDGQAVHAINLIIN